MIMTTLSVGVLHFANAHEAMGGWKYPLECCSNQDCAEYPSENVKEMLGGFKLKEGEFIPRDQARQSPDGHYHICRNPNSGYSLIQPYEKPPCFWYPPQGM